MDMNKCNDMNKSLQNDVERTMKMMRDETKEWAHAMIVRRLDGGNATSLTWLKSREEHDVVADARMTMMMMKLSGEKRRGEMWRSTTKQ